jgi:hypothetical protein
LIPWWGKIYKITTKLPKCHKIYQMAVIYSKSAKNYTNIFHSKANQNLPKLWVWVWKYTIWQPSLLPITP